MSLTSPVGALMATMYVSTVCHSVCVSLSVSLGLLPSLLMNVAK